MADHTHSYAPAASFQDDVAAGYSSGPVTSFDDPRSRTLEEFRAIERFSKATYSKLKEHDHAPAELRVPNSKIVRITYAAHVAWRDHMAELAKTEAAALEQQRRHRQAVEAGKAAAASPLHYSRRGRAGAAS